MMDDQTPVSALPSPAPKKQLSLLDAVMIIVGSMIGSGIFLAPAIIAGITVESRLGPASFVLIWVVGGILTLLAALSFGELAAAFPKTGGQYVFLTEAFHPFCGFLYGWTLFAVIQCGFIAAVSVAFAKYLVVLLPWVGEATIVADFAGIQLSSVQLVAIALIAGLSLLNARGLSSASFTQNLLGFAKTAALGALILLGLASAKGDWSNFHPLAPESITLGVLTGFSVGLSKALFAYDSWNVVTFIAEETKDPSRTIPRALFVGTLSVTLIYSLACISYLYILPVDVAASAPGQRIAASVAEVLMGPSGLVLISLAIVISTAGCVNGLVLSGPWLYYAMARDGLFFRAAGTIDRKSGIPLRSLQYQGVWASALVLSGSFGARGAQLYGDLLTFTSFASLLFNAFTVLGLFALRHKQPGLTRPYRVTAYPWVPGIYLAAALLFLVFIAVGDPRNAGFGSLLILSGIPPYFYWNRRRRKEQRPLGGP